MSVVQARAVDRLEGAGEPDPSQTATGARILGGSWVAAQIRAEATSELAALAAGGGPTPALVVVLMGDDQPSHVYARRILHNASRIGAPGRLVELDASTTAAQLRQHLEALSADPEVGGVMVQMPLPSHVRPREVIVALDPLKDIDGIHPYNAGLAALGHESFVPSCAEAALEILTRNGFQVAGSRCVVVGRSSVVGRPAAQLLLREHATVTVCHRRTRDLAFELRHADIVIAAAGMPGLVRGEMLRPGSVVIDCGTNVVGERLVGDVDAPSAIRVASAITPVPGGVGLVTNAVLLHHFARAVRAQRMGDFSDGLPGRTELGMDQPVAPAH